MKNYKITTGIIAILIASILLAGGYAVNGVADVSGVSQTELTCSERLGQTMDDMHHQMHLVKTSGEPDEDFVRLMLPHHQGAVEMAKDELICGKDAVNRRLAQEIIADQQSEIDLMNLWLSKRESQKISPQTGKPNEATKP